MTQVDSSHRAQCIRNAPVHFFVNNTISVQKLQVNASYFKPNQLTVDAMLGPSSKRATITAYVSPGLKARFQSFIDEIARTNFNIKETQVAEIAIKTFLDRHYPEHESKFKLADLDQLELNFDIHNKGGI